MPKYVPTWNDNDNSVTITYGSTDSNWTISTISLCDTIGFHEFGEVEVSYIDGAIVLNCTHCGLQMRGSIPGTLENLEARLGEALHMEFEESLESGNLVSIESTLNDFEIKIRDLREMISVIKMKFGESMIEHLM